MSIFAVRRFIIATLVSITRGQNNTMEYAGLCEQGRQGRNYQIDSEENTLADNGGEALGENGTYARNLFGEML